MVLLFIMKALERLAHGKHCNINIHEVVAKVVSFSVSVSSKSSSLSSLSIESSGGLSAIRKDLFCNRCSLRKQQYTRSKSCSQLKLDVVDAISRDFVVT